MSHFPPFSPVYVFAFPQTEPSTSQSPLYIPLEQSDLVRSDMLDFTISFFPHEHTGVTIYLATNVDVKWRPIDFAFVRGEMTRA